MASRNTKQSTFEILEAISLAVDTYQRYAKKELKYADSAKKMKDNIFRALERIPKEDFALYKEKIERITKRLNQ